MASPSAPLTQLDAAAAEQLAGLERVLAELAAGTPSPARQASLEDALARFKAEESSLALALAFLHATRNAYVLWYSASVIEYKLQADWLRLPGEVQAAVGAQLASFLAEHHSTLAPFVRNKVMQVLAGVGMAGAPGAMQQLVDIILEWCTLPSDAGAAGGAHVMPAWAPAADSAASADEADACALQLRRNHLGLAALRVLAEELAAGRFPGVAEAQHVFSQRVSADGGNTLERKFLGKKGKEGKDILANISLLWRKAARLARRT